MGYDKNYGNYSGETQTKSLPVTMATVYGWMTLALSVTAFVAYYTAHNETLMKLICTSQMAFWGLMIAELGLVLFLSARITKLSFGTAALMFGAYSILNGFTFSLIFFAFSLGAIYAAFFATAGTFAVMSFIGYTTKKDLSGFGGILIMLLIGLIIGSVVNVFWANSYLEYIITYLGLFVFVGLTAYDTQKIKKWLDAGSQFEGAGIDLRNIGIMGALQLYLDFINLFFYILRLFDGRRS